MTQATDSPTLASLRLIGRFRLKRGDGSAVDLPSRRARALLAYLAMAPERSASRERLCGLLWSDRAEPQARASLRQCLLELRGALSSAGLDLLAVGRDSVTLKSEYVEVDVDRLREALEGEADALTQRLGALASYRFLDDLEVGGLFDEWRSQARESVDRGIAVVVTAKLAALESQDDWAQARALADAYLQRDGLDEGVVAAAIRCDMALGATGAAHRRFQALETGLARELGVTPSATVKAALSAEPPASAPPQSVRIDPPERAAEAIVEPRAALPLPDRPSIAVLPFKNLGGDPDQEYFADAITEDIVTALSRWRWFFVIARDSSFAFRDREVEAGRVAFELGVRYILTGSVRKAGDRVRLSARLIDAADGSNIWTERLDRDLGDMLSLQDDLTERVVASIEPAMLRGEGLRVARKTPTDQTALDLYYRGMWHFHNVQDEHFAAAQALFEESISRDPALALGHVGLARILYARAIFGTSSHPVADLERARLAATTAISLDPREGYAYYSRSGAALYLNDHGAALDDARRAVDVNANFALAHVRLGQVLIFVGRPADAIDPIQRGLRLSPYDPQIAVCLSVLSLAFYQTGDYAMAVEQARNAMNQSPERSSTILAASLARLGRLDEASEVLPAAESRRHTHYRPMTPRYLRVGDFEHIKEGVRLVRDWRSREHTA